MRTLKVKPYIFEYDPTFVDSAKITNSSGKSFLIAGYAMKALLADVIQQRLLKVVHDDLLGPR